MEVLVADLVEVLVEVLEVLVAEPQDGAPKRKPTPQVAHSPEYFHLTEFWHSEMASVPSSDQNVVGSVSSEYVDTAILRGPRCPRRG